MSASGELVLTPLSSLALDTDLSPPGLILMMEISTSCLLCPLFKMSLRQGARILFRKLFPKKKPPPSTPSTINININIYQQNTQICTASPSADSVIRR